MEITKEMLQKQGEAFIQNNEGVKQGYISCLQWVAAVLEAKDEKKDEVLNAEVV